MKNKILFAKHILLSHKQPRNFMNSTYFKYRDSSTYTGQTFAIVLFLTKDYNLLLQNLQKSVNTLPSSEHKIIYISLKKKLHNFNLLNQIKLQPLKYLLFKGKLGVHGSNRSKRSYVYFHKNSFYGNNNTKLFNKFIYSSFLKTINGSVSFKIK